MANCLPKFSVLCPLLIVQKEKKEKRRTDLEKGRKQNQEGRFYPEEEEKKEKRCLVNMPA